MFNKMTISDFKIYLLNSIALVISFSQIEEILKIILLLASITYMGKCFIDLLGPMKFRGICGEWLGRMPLGFLLFAVGKEKQFLWITIYFFIQ